MVVARARPILFAMAVTTAAHAQSSAPPFQLLSEDPAVRACTFAAPLAEDRLFSDDFATLDAQRWKEVTADATPAPAGRRVQLVAEAEGASGLALLGPGLGGMHARLEFTRSDALRVTARVRSFSLQRPAVLRVAELGQDGREVDVAARDLLASDGFCEATVVLERRRGTRRLLLSLLPGDRPLVVDRVDVATLQPVESRWLTMSKAEARALPSGRHRIEIPAMDAEMDGCFVPTDGTLRWNVSIPAALPRLDLETCLIGGDRGGAAKWTITIDGAAIASRSEQLDPSAWDTPFSSWIVPLTRFAGREVTLEVSCRGDRSVLGFVGMPRVLGGPSPNVPTAPNVILVSLDTLRPDRIGERGTEPSLTPRLDRWIAEGTRFRNAASTSSWTLPAHMSLMTGQHPLVHGVVDSDRQPNEARSSLLAERFRTHGYATAAFTAGGYVDPRFGFGRGFESYSVRDPCGLPHEGATVPEAAARDDTVDATLRRAFFWVRRHADAPFFLFLHTYHVHDYDDEANAGAETQRRELLSRAAAGDRTLVDTLRQRYDACIRETDRDLVGGLQDLLAQLRLEQNTIVAIVSDHGEEFLEHGGLLHGVTLHPEVAAVAIALVGPGIARGEQIDAPVSLIDVAPTLARLAGLPADERCGGIDGLAATNTEERALLLHLDHICDKNAKAKGEALWLGEWRVHRLWNEHGEATLTIERRDPATGRIATFEPTPTQRLAFEQRLDAELAAEMRRAPPVVDRRGRELPDALRERLRALGYLGR